MAPIPVYVEAWDPSYGASAQLEEDDGSCVASHNRRGRRAIVRPSGSAAPPDLTIAFVDGIRRTEGFLSFSDPDSGELVRGIAGAYGVGAAMFRPGRPGEYDAPHDPAPRRGVCGPCGRGSTSGGRMELDQHKHARRRCGERGSGDPRADAAGRDHARPRPRGHRCAHCRRREPELCPQHRGQLHRLRQDTPPDLPPARRPGTRSEARRRRENLAVHRPPRLLRVLPAPRTARSVIMRRGMGSCGSRCRRRSARRRPSGSPISPRAHCPGSPGSRGAIHAPPRTCGLSALWSVVYARCSAPPSPL